MTFNEKVEGGKLGAGTKKNLRGVEGVEGRRRCARNLIPRAVLSGRRVRCEERRGVQDKTRYKKFGKSLMAFLFSKKLQKTLNSNFETSSYRRRSAQNQSPNRSHSENQERREKDHEPKAQKKKS